MNLNQIENKLLDDTSKQIFKNRIKYNNGEISAIDDIIKTARGGDRVNQIYGEI